MSLALFFVPAVSAGAQQTDGPVGGEFQINTYTSGFQGGAAVGSDGAGGVVVTWLSDGSDGSDQDGFSIQGQRYASDGAPAGGEFQVNSYTTGNQGAPAVGSDGAGGFVVIWNSEGSGGSDQDGFSIQGQRYASDGSSAGGEFQVNFHTTGNQSAPAVGLDGAGGFVVVWSSQGSGGPDHDGYSVQGQRFAPDGSTLGVEFQVNSYSTGDQWRPEVGADGGGGFVVVWQSAGSAGPDNDESSIQGQRFGSDGTPVGGEFQINSHTTGSQYDPDVGPDGAGGFVVAWSREGPAGYYLDWNIQGQRFDPIGAPVGGEFQVNAYTTSYQGGPAVSLDRAGGFVVVWSSYGSSGNDASYFSVQGHRFNSDGSPRGGEFQVNTSTAGSQLGPAVSSHGTSDFIVAWTSPVSGGSDTSGSSIQGQRFGSSIFADGFESGDTAAWSTTVP